MKPIHVILKKGRTAEYPSSVCLIHDGNRILKKLFDPSNNKPIKEIKNELERIKKAIEKAVNLKTPIITNDRLSFNSAFKISNNDDPNVYDYNRSIDNDVDFDIEINTSSLNKNELYHKLAYNAGVVYDYLSQSPIYINYTPVQPIWSMETYSGRSKCQGFNIQGYNKPDFVTRDGFFDNKVLIHFDWLCADLRIASVLSDDAELESSFENDDPYEHLFLKSNGMLIDRKDSKISLLKAINSLDFDSKVFDICYPRLKDWLIECGRQLVEGVKLKTILGKEFEVPDSKTVLSAINGVLQGSIAHAMQNTIHRIYKIYPRNIICEIHDSLVMSCDSDKASIKLMIKKVMEIMSKPFDGILEKDIYFPLRYGVGKKWRCYKYSEIQRNPK